MPLDLIFNGNGQPGQDGVADHIRVVVGGGTTSPFHDDYSDGTDYSNAPSIDLLIDQHSLSRWQVSWDYNTEPQERLDIIRIIKY